ncbi:MAG: hypothetical protein U1F83_03160 [Verrucomicrobiota bacterium]
MKPKSPTPVKSLLTQDNWTVQSLADHSGRRRLTISDTLTHPDLLRRIRAKRRRRVVLNVMSAPEELSAFTPVIHVRS